jgi:hypothetical protein
MRRNRAKEAALRQLGSTAPPLLLTFAGRAARSAVRPFSSLPPLDHPPRARDLLSMIAFIDVVASGLVSGYPIEIGYARADGAVGAILIQPHAEWISDLHWDPSAEYIHSLTRELLVEHGTQIDDAVDALNAALAGCRCISDSPSNDWRWLSLLLEFFDRGPREFTFDLLNEPAEPLMLGIAESLGVAPLFVEDVFRSARARPLLHTAAGDAAGWSAMLEAVKTRGNIELILPRWMKRARAAMPWRSSKTADFSEIAAEQLAKFDDALSELAHERPPPKPRC